LSRPAVVFDPVAHTFEIEGARVPSVSSVLRACGAYQSFSGLSGEAREGLLDRGRRAHEAIAKALTTGESEPGEMGRLAQQAEAFLSDWGAEDVLMVEQPIGSLRLVLGGIPDAVIIDRDARPWIVDWKAGSSVLEAYALQLALYAELFAERVGLKPNDVGLALVSLREDRWSWLDCEERWPGCRARARGLVEAYHWMQQEGFEMVRRSA
jgi:predicted RecB family nuclease